MKYQIVCKDTKISPVVQEDIIKRLSRLEKMLFKSDEFECRVVVKFRNNKSKVEVTIPTPYLLLRSEVEAFELVEAIDIATKKLQNQINKVKAKLSRMTKYEVFAEILNQYKHSVETEDYSWLEIEN